MSCLDGNQMKEIFKDQLHLLDFSAMYDGWEIKEGAFAFPSA